MTRILAIALMMALSGTALAAESAPGGGAGAGGPAPAQPPSAGPAPTGDALRDRLVGRWSPDSADECTGGDGVVFFRSGGMLITEGNRPEREGIGSWTVEGATLTMRYNRRTSPEAQPETLSFSVTQDFSTYLQGDLARRGRTRQEQLYRCPQN